MLIKRVIISGFRGIKSACILFPKHSVLIGANNVGKTTLIEAIALALGRDKLVPNINDYDFLGGFFDDELPEAKRFNINVLLTGFRNNNPDNHPDWFNVATGGVECWWNEKTQECTYEQPALEEVRDKYSLCIEIGCCGYYEPEECEFKVIRYFIDGTCDPAAGDMHKTIPQKLLRELGVFLLSSNRTWDKTLTFIASSFIKLLRDSDALPHEFISDLRTSLSNISPSPELDVSGKITAFGEIISSVEKELRNIGFLTSNDAVLQYRPTSLDVKALLGSLIPNIKHGEEVRIPLAKQGDGLKAFQNLLLLLELAKRRKDKNLGFILLAEEPELHLYPGLQENIVQKIRSYSTQTIVSTHSPFVAGTCPVSDVRVIKRVDDGIQVENLIPETQNPEDKNLIKEYFFNDRIPFISSILGEKILVPEGKLDASWIRLIYNISLRYNSEDSRISGLACIKTKDSQLLKTATHLRRLGCIILPLADGDGAGKKYIAELTKEGFNPVVRWEDDIRIEGVVAWIFESGIELIKDLHSDYKGTLPNDRESLKSFIVENKKEIILHEELAVKLAESKDVQKRAWQLISDLSCITAGGNIKDELKLVEQWSKDENIDNCWILKI